MSFPGTHTHTSKLYYGYRKREHFTIKVLQRIEISCYKKKWSKHGEKLSFFVCFLGDLAFLQLNFWMHFGENLVAMWPYCFGWLDSMQYLRFVPLFFVCRSAPILICSTKLMTIILFYVPPTASRRDLSGREHKWTQRDVLFRSLPKHILPIADQNAHTVELYENIRKSKPSHLFENTNRNEASLNDFLLVAAQAWSHDFDCHRRQTHRTSTSST